MDDCEYDIYDDLDVFDGNKKQEKEVNFDLESCLFSQIFGRHNYVCACVCWAVNLFIHFQCESCAELRDQLNKTQQQNAHLTNELSQVQKSYEELKVNSSALLQTVRQEIQRKDTRIKDLQKE